jgi:hypothetical protein
MFCTISWYVHRWQCTSISMRLFEILNNRRFYFYFFLLPLYCDLVFKNKVSNITI